MQGYPCRAARGPVFLFSHGAGAGIDSKPCRHWIRQLSSIGTVEPFNYSYIEAVKRRPPPPISKIVIEHVAAFRRCREKYPGRPIVMVGRSMGSRVACHASQEGADAVAIICLSYPLIGANHKVRDEVLRELHVPIMFVQGTRDKMAPLARLKALVATLHVKTLLHVVDGGDHSLELTKKNAVLYQEERDCEAIEAIKGFYDSVLGGETSSE